MATRKSHRQFPSSRSWKVEVNWIILLIHSVDVTNREKVLETGSIVLKDVGDVSILVNNAGIMPQHEILKHTEAEVRKIYDINTIAHCWMFQAFLPKMIEKNQGHIVALSSIAGIVGLNNLVPYCGSKFAVRGTMESLSEELRCHSGGKSKVKFCNWNGLRNEDI